MVSPDSNGILFRLVSCSSQGEIVFLNLNLFSLQNFHMFLSKSVSI